MKGHQTTTTLPPQTVKERVDLSPHRPPVISPPEFDGPEGALHWLGDVLDGWRGKGDFHHCPDGNFIDDPRIGGGDVPVPDDGIGRDGRGNPTGCLSCDGPPTVSGDLALRKKDNSPIAKECDGTPRPKLAPRIEWRYAETGKLADKEYQPNVDEASAYTKIETFTELSNISTTISNIVTGAAATVSTGGSVALVNQIRNVSDRIRDIIFGDPNRTVLFGRVTLPFSLASAGSVTIKHVHQWKAFVSGQGLYDFKVKALVDGESKPDLTVPNAAERARLKKPAATQPAPADPANPGNAPAKAPLLVAPERLNDPLCKSRPLDSSQASMSLPLSAGDHQVDFRYELRSGFDSLLGPSGLKALNDLLQSLLDAGTQFGTSAAAVLQALVANALPGGGTAPSVGDVALTEAAKVGQAAFQTFQKAANALIEFLKVALDAPIAYVRLMSSNFALTCA